MSTRPAVAEPLAPLDRTAAPERSATPPTGALAAIRRALRLTRPDERRRIAAAAALSALAGLSGTALLGLSGYLIARAAEQPPVLSLTVAIVCVRALGLLRAVARYGERLIGHEAALGVLSRLRGDLFAALLPVRAARRAGVSAETADALVADVDRVQDAYLRSIAPLAAAAIVAAAGITTALAVLPAAALALLGTVLVVGVLLPALAQALGRRLAGERRRRRAGLVRELAATLDAAEELVMRGAGPARRAELARRAAALARVEDHEHRTTVLLGAAASATAGLGVVAILGIALGAVADGRLDPVLVGLLALLALGVGEVLAAVPAAAAELHATADAVRRVEALLADAPADRPPADRPEGAAVALTGLEVRRGGRTILDGVDLAIGEGERVALVGPSGVGKSTIGDLLVGFLEPEAVTGTATIGGADLAALDGEELRRIVLHVPQDPYLFDASLRANLLLARPDAGDDELLDALAAVGAGPWLASLRDGLGTPLGERGARCSGGERQRIGLARAILARGHRLLVLDEPAGHLPAADAVGALRAVLDADPARGALLIAHRDEERALAQRTVALAPLPVA